MGENDKLPLKGSGVGEGGWGKGGERRGAKGR